MALSMAVELWLRAYRKLAVLGWVLFCIGSAVDIIDSIHTSPWAKKLDQMDLDEALLTAGVLLICLAFMDMVRQKRTLIDVLKHASRTDELTRLANRRAFFEDFPDVYSMQNPKLVFLDLDNFKQVNDNYGHEAGDYVLVRVSKAVCSLLSDEEKAYRLGGDEFVFILDDPNPELRINQLENTLKPELSRYQFGLTAGYTSVTRNQTVDELLHQADQKMYSAKPSKLRQRESSNKKHQEI
ncbi:GGDEF domain-containing protein [Teredinibacter sp. KSP-S5-2]|uniref:GGDEF domain-containing protein n=1 Tax=Teredinibacter sp. KSP-S5-2 TaxID=3034506 RepID=UPI002934468D|nr:GGDEF domain-containing protein [Teredinibacter sp. KSP-S5-2]WNO08857.1 GGDEF domain-containing protein [Teredinibacter sp. KSP-S5-2]